MFGKNTGDGRVSTSTQSTGRVQSRRWRLFWSYAPDWCLTILLWGLFYLLDKIDGYRRLFDVTDTSLAHPYATSERIPVWLLTILSGIVPALIIIFVAGVIRRSFWDAHSGILGLVLALGLTVTFTDILKITAGRPRPDLFDRCQLPSSLTSNPTHGLTSWTACTRTDQLKDGFRSFPSGHSSFAWCGGWYLILYLAAKMRLDNRTGYTWKSWLLLAPLSCASLIAISRTMDYRHHATDVIAGGIIGILGGWYGYRQYYPALSHPQAYKPYSPRIPAGVTEALPLHRKRSRDRRGADESRPSAERHLNASTDDHQYPPYAFTPESASASMGRRTGDHPALERNDRDVAREQREGEGEQTVPRAER